MACGQFEMGHSRHEFINGNVLYAHFEFDAAHDATQIFDDCVEIWIGDFLKE